MSDNTANSELRNTWESAAPGWARWERTLSEGLADATDALIDMAGVRPGMRVLDVACGAGNQSLRVAERVGSSGSVVASDISATMLEFVRANAARAGVLNIETREYAAENLDEADGPFDAAICRVGLMLFPSPRKALEALQRVLKPSGRFAALVFTTPANNPYMAQPMAILMQYAGKSPPAPGQPGIFALGGEGILEGLMKESGFVDVQTQTVRAQLRLPSASDALEMMQQAFGVYRAIVANLDPEEKARAWNEVHKCLKRFESNGNFETELEFIIGSGARPT
ncbi:MAG: SAM-dependent methyltransferase [Rhodospirillaceae bacterium]|nr:SAM-dependent methyltransferase [Rhodospirillaceae bacterium]|tara:strand:+ start:1616 stop:2464 length:849 start_codon:yes stop_codon:yes gene_type:complete